jgi:hypothetical protein
MKCIYEELFRIIFALKGKREFCKFPFECQAAGGSETQCERISNMAKG